MHGNPVIDAVNPNDEVMMTRAMMHGASSE
jgi:hypothetical protein